MKKILLGFFLGSGIMFGISVFAEDLFPGITITKGETYISQSSPIAIVLNKVDLERELQEKNILLSKYAMLLESCRK